MKPSSDLEQRSDATRDVDTTGGGRGDARQNFQKRTLTRPVAPDNAQDLAVTYLERRVPERPDRSVLDRGTRGSGEERPREDFRDRVSQRAVPFTRTDSILLTEIVRANDQAHQTTSAKVSSVRRK